MDQVIAQLPGRSDSELEARVRQMRETCFKAFTVSPAYTIPGPLSETQIQAVKAAVDLGANLVAEQLRIERA